MLNLGSLNPQQRLAVETISGPVLILAGAGTGKTRVITYRIAHMIAKGIPPDQILAVTFTNKAAREMKKRARELATTGLRGVRDDLNAPTISTFHSLGVQILREHIDLLGYKKNFVIYDEGEQQGVIKKILSHISAKGEKTDPALILALLGRLRTGSLSFGVSATDDSAAALAEHLRSRYERLLRACNALDFDDLLLLTVRLFREHPEILTIFRERYRYVMVDEYQDTNALQFQLLQLLTIKHKNLCVVGDDDQSIYGWRGANAANLLDLEKHFPQVKVIKLEQNYRSTNVILQAANAVIKNNLRRRGKQLWSKKGQGAKITLFSFSNDEEEARTIVEEIEHARVIKRISWSDQAILFRTNIQARPLETALRQAGVRYHLIGGQSFFDRREIKDFLAYLKVCINPHDDISLVRIANVPARGLGDLTMERLLAASHECHTSVFSAMKNSAVLTTFPARTGESISVFVEFIERARLILNQSEPISLETWANKLLEETGYFAELQRSEKDAAESRLRHLKDLIASLDGGQPVSANPGERLQSFVEEISLENDRAQEKEIAGDALTLITIHSCKGLEFPHVYLVGVEEGLLPHFRSKSEGTLDEERRLFYVAITRTMESLAISYCHGRKKYGKLVPCYPSSFLQELPDELVEPAEQRATIPITADSGKNFFASLRASISSRTGLGR